MFKSFGCIIVYENGFKLYTHRRMQNNFYMHIMPNCSLFMNKRDTLLGDLFDFVDVFEYGFFICKIPKPNI